MSVELQPPRERRQDDAFARGMAYMVLLYTLQIPMALLFGGVSPIFIGVTQLLYFIPVLVVLVWKKQSETAKGLGTAAGITFLLNATCTALFLWTMK